MYHKRNKELELLALYLSGYKKQFYLREISKLANIPLKTTQNILFSLEKEKIIKSIQKGKNKYFRLNLENIKTKLYLLQSEIYRTLLFIDRYPVFRTFLKEVKTMNLIIVFGSFAKFKADKNSDLDLLIISKDNQKIPLYLLPYKIHEIKLSENSFIKSLEKKETLIKEIEENHIILNNHFFYVSLMWKYYEK